MQGALTSGARGCAAPSCSRNLQRRLVPRVARRVRIAPRDAARGATAGSNGLSSEGVASVAGGVAVGTKQPGAEQEAQQQQATDLAAPATAASPEPKSHPLALPDDMFAAEELVAELTDPAAMGKRGELWLLAQGLAMLFVVWPPFKLAGLFDLLATLALVAGLVFCVYGLISLGRNFSPLPAPRKNHSLVTSGLYGHIRHPIYGGLILAALGLSAITRSEGRLALSILLWVVVEQKAKAEEAALTARYGGDYRSYMDATKKFIPFLY